MPRPRPRNSHPDLFAPESPQLPIAGAERKTELLALVSALLTQALVACPVVEEASDEDHA